MPKTQEWIKQKLEEERQGWTEYGNRRLTEELEELKQRVSDLEIVYEEMRDELSVRQITDWQMCGLALSFRRRVSDQTVSISREAKTKGTKR